MQPKITNTSVLTLYSLDGTFWYYLQRDINREQSKTISVTEGKLVLVECKPEKEHTLIARTIGSKGFHLYKSESSFSPSIVSNVLYYKPIIISKTEKIEVNNKVLFLTQILTVDSIDEDGYVFVKEYETLNINSQYLKKILVLPNQFSPQHLEDIVEGRLKDGDKVLVECEYYNSIPSSAPHPKDWLKEYIIKLNSQGYVTLHQVEEKMYTRADLLKLLEWCGPNTYHNSSKLQPHINGYRMGGPAKILELYENSLNKM